MGLFARQFTRRPRASGAAAHGNTRTSNRTSMRSSLVEVAVLRPPSSAERCRVRQRIQNIQITQEHDHSGCAYHGFTSPSGQGRGREVSTSTRLRSRQNFRLGFGTPTSIQDHERYACCRHGICRSDFTGVTLVAFITFVEWFVHVHAGRRLESSRSPRLKAYTSSYTNAITRGHQPARLLWWAAGARRPPRRGFSRCIARRGLCTPANLNASFAWKNWELSGYVRNIV